MSVRLISLAFCTALCGLALPAAAQTGVVDAEGRVFDGPIPDPRPEWRGPPPGPGQPMAHPPLPQGEQARHYPADWEQARANWLAECRRRHGSRNKVGGALVGGVIGGVVGNRVAGRGNRAVGTVAGAAVGAVAGGAIGDAADKRAARDYCEAYLEQHTSWSHGGAMGPGYGQPVVGYGYAPMTVMVPVAYVQVAAPAQPRECVETVVTEEWVTVREKRKVRYIKPRPEKRVKIVPDKRVRIN
ncbi:MAG: glycine zipper 2TM domain-containing protein [Novosphingobium sp.]